VPLRLPAANTSSGSVPDRRLAPGQIAPTLQAALGRQIASHIQAVWRARISSVRTGGGVIWHRIHLEAHVIPAQAGIHCAGRWKRSADRLDSRLRGNDGTREPPCLSNDATTGLEIEDIEQSRTVARHCTLKGMPVPRLRDGLYDPRAAGFSAIC